MLADSLSLLCGGLLVRAPFYFHSCPTPCRCCCCWLWRADRMHLPRIVVDRVASAAGIIASSIRRTNEHRTRQCCSWSGRLVGPIAANLFHENVRRTDGPIGGATAARVRICKHLSKVDVNCSVLLLLILQTQAADACNWCSRMARGW